jgi:hypothetical protein
MGDQSALLLGRHVAGTTSDDIRLTAIADKSHMLLRKASFELQYRAPQAINHQAVHRTVSRVLLLRQATREHMPPKSLFDGSHRPDKLVMPACHVCNNNTSKPQFQPLSGFPLAQCVPDLFSATSLHAARKLLRWPCSLRRRVERGRRPNPESPRVQERRPSHEGQHHRRALASAPHARAPAS